MTEGSEHGYNEVHIPPSRDTVTSAEYMQSLERLREFAEADIRGISDISDTAEITDKYRVGLSLRAVAIQHGTPRKGAYKKEGVLLPDYSLVRNVEQIQMMLSLSPNPHGSPHQGLYGYDIAKKFGIDLESGVQYCFFSALDMTSRGPFRNGYSVNIPATVSLSEFHGDPHRILAQERQRQRYDLRVYAF